MTDLPDGPTGVSSSALGERETVYLIVYRTAEQMQRAGHLFNGEPLSPMCLGMTQTYADEDGRTTAVIVRLAQRFLTAPIIAHELHHAALAIYGAHVGNRISRRAHLTHHNEPAAHLFSELLDGTLRHLLRRGYKVEL